MKEESEKKNLNDRMSRLIEIGAALSKVRDIPWLLELILKHAKEMTRADGGTIYTVTSRKLHFEIAMTDSLHFHVGGTSQQPIAFPDLDLFLADGKANETLMVAYAVNHKTTITIKDAYHEEGFDFSGTRLFDQTTGYRTQAVLTVPIKNHEDEIIAVMQLINPIEKETGEVTVFSKDDERVAESLASQAGIALTNQLLIFNLKKLLESLTRMIAEAIDHQSPSTGNHSKRVPLLAFLLAEAINESTTAPFKEVVFTKEQLYELEIAALLHDCGKIATPMHLIERRTKLETIFDRIELIDARIEALRFKMRNELLSKQLQWIYAHVPHILEAAKEPFATYQADYEKELKALEQDQQFIHRCNSEQEPMTAEALEHIRAIANLKRNHDAPLLTPDEEEHLAIPKGNLTPKERKIVEFHVVLTYRMLSQLNYPKELREVPEIAASHHERVDGSGYPRGLKRNELSIRARLLAIVDVFEALSAPDRPYKKPHKLSEALDIMQKMVDEGHLDPDLFAIFLQKKVYLKYAKQYLHPEQIDVD